MARALEEVCPGGEGAGGLRFARVGESPARLLAPDVAAVRLPGGRDVPRGGRPLRSGLYRGDGALLAVNLVSEAESDNRPAAARALAEVGARPPAMGTDSVDGWGLAAALAAVAIALVAAEWVVSARRT